MQTPSPSNVVRVPVGRQFRLIGTWVGAICAVLFLGVLVAASSTLEPDTPLAARIVILGAFGGFAGLGFFLLVVARVGSSRARLEIHPDRVSYATTWGKPREILLADVRGAHVLTDPRSAGKLVGQVAGAAGGGLLGGAVGGALMGATASAGDAQRPLALLLWRASGRRTKVGLSFFDPPAATLIANALAAAGVDTTVGLRSVARASRKRARATTSKA